MDPKTEAELGMTEEELRALASQGSQNAKDFLSWLEGLDLSGARAATKAVGGQPSAPPSGYADPNDVLGPSGYADPDDDSGHFKPVGPPDWWRRKEGEEPDEFVGPQPTQYELDRATMLQHMSSGGPIDPKSWEQLGIPEENITRFAQELGRRRKPVTGGPGGGGLAKVDPLAKLPEDLRSRSGYYPPDYDLQVQLAMGEGRITPSLAKAALEAWQKWKSSPTGLEVGAQRDEMDHAQAQLDGQKRQQDIQAEGWHEVQSAMDAGFLQLGDVERERQAYVKQYEQRFEQELTQYKAAVERLDNYTVDPYADFIGGAVQAHIASILGGIGSLLNKGQPNIAAQLVQQKVENTLKAKEIELQNKSRSLGHRFNMLGMMRSHFGDMEMAREATKKAVYDRIGMLTESMMAGTKSKLAQARGQSLLAGLDKLRSASEKRLEGAIKSSAELAARRAAIGRLKAKARENEVASGWKTLTPKEGPQSEAWTKRYTQEGGGFARTAQEAMKFDQQMGALRKMKYHLGEMRKNSQFGDLASPNAWTMNEYHDARYREALREGGAGAFDKGWDVFSQRMAPPSIKGPVQGAWDIAVHGGDLDQQYENISRDLENMERELRNSTPVTPGQYEYNDEGLVIKIKNPTPVQGGYRDEQADKSSGRVPSSSVDFKPIQ